MSFGDLQRTFLPTKRHLLRIFVICSFVANGENLKFFSDGPLHVSWLGREVKNDMSGQSKYALGVCNVKIRKSLPGLKRGTS